MASPARPAAASVSGAFGLSPDPKRCSFDQALRQKVQQSVQVLQEKQELAETQREMSKLQIVHEDSAQKSEGAEQRQQPQQLHSLGNGSFVPQPSKLGPCGVAPYTIHGSAQAYNTAYGSPSSNPATIVAVLNQQAHGSAPMVFHHLGPQSVQNHPDIAEKAARLGYPKDPEGVALRMVAAGQPAEYNPMHDRLSSVSHGVAPHAWSG
nr:unnamed protein product [Digitaria exilis]